MLFISQLFNSLIQIVLFSLLPLVWWLICAQKKENFFSWLGLKRVGVENKKGCVHATLIVVAAFLVLSIGILWMMRDVETATSQFTGMGIAALPAALVYALFNTALPEEILFRGFLLKRLSGKFGFGIANLVQSFLFGLLHGLLFFSVIGAMQALLVVLFTGGIGWSMGYVNEKRAGGSIVPSVVIHGTANLFSSLIAMFALL